MNAMPPILPITIPANLVANYAEAKRLHEEAAAKYRAAEEAEADAYNAWSAAGRNHGTYDNDVRPLKRAEQECGRVTDDAFARFKNAQSAVLAVIDTAVTPPAVPPTP
jgi:hypothetical protein